MRNFLWAVVFCSPILIAAALTVHLSELAGAPPGYGGTALRRALWLVLFLSGLQLGAAWRELAAADQADEYRTRLAALAELGGPEALARLRAAADARAAAARWAGPPDNETTGRAG